jgi:hypothetical protein
MRVLARREPVNRRDARLVVTPGRPVSSPVVTSKRSSTGATDAALVQGPRSGGATALAPTRREAARSAAARRRRVLGVLLLATLGVTGLAAFGVIGWVWIAVPAAVVVAWLVACRLMVKQERTVRTPRAAAVDAAPAPAPAEAPAPAVAQPDQPVAVAEPDVFEDTSSMPAVQVPPADPTLWDPVPVTLPTYVTKPAAGRRTVRTIDLDDTGVWTSGRTDADAAIARDAHAADRAERTRRAEGSDHRAVGS